jgi:hypothetical protein
MGKNVRVFTQLKQMPIRYALFFISDHIKQNLYAFYNRQADDKIKKKKYDGMGSGEKTMYESHP